MGAARLGAGVHPGCGSVLERDHRDARGDSRTRSEYAESGGEECERGGLNAEFARAGIARGGSRLFGFADQRGRAADAATGNADEGFAASPPRASTWTPAISNSFDV